MARLVMALIWASCIACKLALLCLLAATLICTTRQGFAPKPHADRSGPGLNHCIGFTTDGPVQVPVLLGAVTVAVAGGTSSSSINWQAGAGQVDVVWERLDTLQLLARAAPPQARRRLLQLGHVGRQHRFLFALLGESDGLSKGTGKETSGRRSSSASAAESCEQDRRRSSQILKHKARTCMVRTTRLRYSCILKFALASRHRRRKRAQRLCA